MTESPETEAETEAAALPLPLAAISRLTAWFSAGYPLGAFAYSHGLEAVREAGGVSDGPTLESWLSGILRHGAGWSDAILLAEAWRRPEDEGIAAIARALAPSRERLLETEAQGEAFARVTAAAWGGAASPAPFPVAVGHAARAGGVPLTATVATYLQAFSANLISAGIRLIPIGQTEGQQILARLVPLCHERARAAAHATLDDLGGCAIAADIAAMRHETQEVRLFRT